jgi:pyridinium-3,5-bisthiocarboxylic acid mononucleotide nickel chelatase
MSVLYFDAFSGVSGDMTVGALLSLGLPLERVRAGLQQLPLGDYTIAAEPRHVHGIAATKFQVRAAPPGHRHRSFRDIRGMIEAAGLEAGVARHALAIFTKLAAAEGRVHGVVPDDVEFHEVGAVDAIVDVVATAIGVTALGVDGAYTSALPLGSGTVPSAHGTLPVPGPATLELLRGFSVRVADGDGELVTPTGAAIVAALAAPEPPPELRVQAVGYGAGARMLADRPNLLRLVLAERAAIRPAEDLLVVETNIDDCNPEFYEYVMERLFAAGARDVYLVPVHMKKNRPGIVLNVLCAAADRERLAAIILSETSAIGLRYHPVARNVLERETTEVTTAYGCVRVKVARGPDAHENLAPEYEDCKRLARERGVPIKLVYQAALVAAAARR